MNLILKRFARLYLVCFLIALTTVSSKAQNAITGTVLDSLTRQPVQFANVFLANSSVGTMTDEKGHFLLQSFVSGKYDLIASFVGYKTISRSLIFSDQSQTQNFLLRPEVVQLNEVVINPNFKQKESDMKLFLSLFIGQNKNSTDCKIVNQKNVFAYIDDDLHSLIGFAHTPIEIRNEALGYRIFYELENFEVNFGTLTQNYAGIPRFEELVSKKVSQKRKWEDERRRAYEGSFVHLIHCLRKGIVKGPFELRELYRVPNRNRLSEEFLKHKVTFWREQFFKNLGGTPAQNKMLADSMQYYNKLYDVPPVLDSLGRLFIRTEQLLDETRDHFTYTGLLQVIYTGEAEEPAFVNFYNTNHGDAQYSVIQFKNKGVAIYDNGYYEPLTDVFFDGYMMWSDRISNLLPREYVPGN
jgi:hypothetical protein